MQYLLFVFILVFVAIIYFQYTKIVSLQKKLDAQKDTSPTFLQNYLNLITERIIIMHFSLDGQIEKVSNAYGNIFGYDKEELLGQFIDKNHFSPSRTDKSIWNILCDEGFFEGDMELASKEGEPYWMYKQIVKHIDDDGKHIGYISISHDITAVKAFEEQQKILLQQSRHAVMGEMISMIAHQWRQPLSTISSILSNIQLDIELDTFEQKNFQKSMAKIQNIHQHLSQTVQDFHKFFKPDKKTAKTNVSQLVSEALSLIEFKVKGVVIYKDIDETLSYDLFQSELLQVLINLLSNAIDAMHNVEDPTLNIVLTPKDEKSFTLSICDNGSGIKDEDKDKIFEPYFSTKSKNGMGLGLYICKIIVEQHLDGSITTKNLDEGCCFSLEVQAK